GTTKGLARFQDGKFTAYTTADGLPNNLIYVGEQDQAGRVWMMANRELVQFDGRRFVTYRFREGLLAGFLIPRRQGGFWVTATTGVALFFDGKFVLYPHLSRSPWYMRTLFEDREGTLWIGYNLPPMLQRFQAGRFSSYAMKSNEYET